VALKSPAARDFSSLGAQGPKNLRRRTSQRHTEVLRQLPAVSSAPPRDRLCRSEVVELPSGTAPRRNEASVWVHPAPIVLRMCMHCRPAHVGTPMRLSTRCGTYLHWSS
jgi:hypothetical protein